MGGRPGHRFQAGGFYLRGCWGGPPDVFSSNSRFWRWDPWEDVNVHAGHEGRYGAFTMDEMLHLNYNLNTLNSFDDSSYSTRNTPRAFESRHRDYTMGVTLRPAYTLNRLPLLGGKAYARSWLGARYDRHEDRTASGEAEKTFSVYTLSLASELEFRPWAKLSMVVGVQADLEVPEEIDGFDPDSTYHVGPMFQVFLRPTDPVFLKLQATHRTRFLTLKERYSSALGGRIPNPDLKPETAWNLGLDAGYAKGPVRIVAGGFFSDVTDLIEERVRPGGDEQTIDNLGGVRYVGTEALFEWAPGRGITLNANYAFLHHDREGAPEENRLGYRPAHRGSVGLTYARKEVLEASTRVRAVSGQDFQNPDTGRWGRLGAYSVWDAFLRVRPIRSLSLWLQLENLLDADYQNAYGFPEPGRTFWVGIRGYVG